MTNGPKKPGRRDRNRDGEPDTPRSAPSEATPGAEPTPEPMPEPDPAMREDDPAAARALPDAAEDDGTVPPGRPDAADEIEDRTVPDLDGSPIGSDDDRPVAPAYPAEDEHAARSGFAATALKVLLLTIVVFGLSLWLVPNLAPHLPSGIARHLMPGQAELDERLAALTEKIEANSAQIATDIGTIRQQLQGFGEQLASTQSVAEAARTEADSASASAAESATAAGQNASAGAAAAEAQQAAENARALADKATAAATQAGEAAAGATSDTAELGRRMSGLEAQVATLADQVKAVNDTLAQGAGEGGPSSAELAAAFAALKAEVESLSEQVAAAPAYLTADEAQRFATQDDLRTARTALEAQFTQSLASLPAPASIATVDELDELRTNAEAKVSQVIDQMNAIGATAQQAAQSADAAEAAASAAVGRVDEAIRQASLRSAAAAVLSRLTNGLPYAGALGEAASLKGAPPPPELSGPAEKGVATAQELLDRFGPAARAAVQARLEAQSGGGILGQARARLHSVIAGRPASEQPGDTVEAILSRIEARLRDVDLAAALAEAGNLPPEAQAALGGWLDRLKTRVAAAEAAERYLAPAETQG